MDDAGPEMGDAARELMAGERQRLGAAPSPEELIAYADGTLPAADRERVEDAVAADPEVARAVAALRELPEAEPGGLGEGEPAAGWEELRGRLAATGFFDREAAARPVGRPRRRAWSRAALGLAAVAAAALLAVGFWAGSRWGAGAGRGAHLARLNPQIFTLAAEGEVARGAGSRRETLREGSEAVVLVLPLLDAGDFEDYRAAVTAAGGRTVWESAGLRPSESGAFTVELPAALLEPGVYRVTLRGEGPGRSETLAAYPLELVVE